MSSHTPQFSLKEEAQIIELLKLGDATAVEFWYNTYQERIKNYIAAKVEPQADVHELVQDTFLSCLKNLPLFRGNASLHTWMIAVARHEVADYYRKKYAKKALTLLPLSQFLLGVPISNSHDTSEKVKDTLAQMTHGSRELLLKKYVDNQKVAEIAEELGRTVKSVESELFRARGEFKSLYLAIETSAQGLGKVASPDLDER